MKAAPTPSGKTAQKAAISVAAALVAAPASAAIAMPAASAAPCIPDPISLECTSNEPAPESTGDGQLPPGLDADLPDLPEGPDVPGDAPGNPETAPGS